jgi:hypothetical protein
LHELHHRRARDAYSPEAVDRAAVIVPQTSASPEVRPRPSGSRSRPVPRRDPGRNGGRAW